MLTPPGGGHKMAWMRGLLLFTFWVWIAAGWSVLGCAKEEKRGPSLEAAPPSEAGTPAAPSAPPPPIAPPLGGDPHPPLTGPLSQSMANQVMERINQYKERLKADPQDLEALIALGNANFDIQRYEQAKDLYLQALEIDPENVLVRTDLASCYRNLGDTARSLEELNRVLAANPTHETALYNLGVILLNDKQDTQGAISAWEKLIAAHPDVDYAEALQEKVEQLKAGAAAPAEKR